MAPHAMSAEARVAELERQLAEAQARAVKWNNEDVAAIDQLTARAEAAEAKLRKVAALREELRRQASDPKRSPTAQLVAGHYGFYLDAILGGDQ